MNENIPQKIARSIRDFLSNEWRLLLLTVSPDLAEASRGVTAELEILVNNASIPDGTIPMLPWAKAARTFTLSNVETIDLAFFNDEWEYFLGNYAINVLF